MKTIPLEFNGMSLRVTGDYCPGYGATWTDPGCDASFEVYRVMDRDVDVTHLYDDEELEEIEALALEAVGDDAAFERQQAFEYMRDSMRVARP